MTPKVSSTTTNNAYIDALISLNQRDIEHHASQAGKDLLTMTHYAFAPVSADNELTQSASPNHRLVKLFNQDLINLLVDHYKSHDFLRQDPRLMTIIRLVGSVSEEIPQKILMVGLQNSSHEVILASLEVLDNYLSNGFDSKQLENGLLDALLALPQERKHPDILQLVVKLLYRLQGDRATRLLFEKYGFAHPVFLELVRFFQSLPDSQLFMPLNWLRLIAKSDVLRNELKDPEQGALNIWAKHRGLPTNASLSQHYQSMIQEWCNQGGLASYPDLLEAFGAIRQEATDIQPDNTVPQTNPTSSTTSQSPSQIGLTTIKEILLHYLISTTLEMDFISFGANHLYGLADLNLHAKPVESIVHLALSADAFGEQSDSAKLLRKAVKGLPTPKNQEPESTYHAPNHHLGIPKSIRTYVDLVQADPNNNANTPYDALIEGGRTLLSNAYDLKVTSIQAEGEDILPDSILYAVNSHSTNDAGLSESWTVEWDNAMPTQLKIVNGTDSRVLTHDLGLHGLAVGALGTKAPVFKPMASVSI